jgi:hypothetical protein
MLPLVHIYTATKVAKKKTPLLVIGSVLPDMVWIDRKSFPPEKLHDNIDEFYIYIKENHTEMLDLALGMKLHSNKVGADYYSHVYKGGYSYTKGKPLIPELTKLVRSNDEKKISDLSHNFIEAALDVNMLKIEPSILNLYKSSVDKIKLDEISQTISEYIKIDYKKVYRTAQMLFDVVRPQNLASDELIAKEILPKMIRLSFGKDVETEELLRIIRKALLITENDYEDLFEEMISGMRKDFF